MLSTELRHVNRIANDLSHLMPFGVVFLTNAPRMPMPGIEAPDQWLWFDPPSLTAQQVLRSVLDEGQYCLSGILLDIIYLVERIYLRATYKVHRVGNHDIVMLRLYAVPTDIDGNRFLQSYRSSLQYKRSLSWHSERYLRIMKNLITVLDYSQDSWDGLLTSSPKMVFSALQSFKEFDFNAIGTGYYTDDSLSFHLSRLVERQSYSFPERANCDPQTRLSDVYNSLFFQVDRTDDLFIKAQNIDSLKNKLYNYQIESVAKMYINESDRRYSDMPHILRLKGHISTFDTYSLTFSRTSEVYRSPRGGILAENMGLGKTLICLALIALTRAETSVPPDSHLVKASRDYHVLSLAEQCVRYINRKSIPWREYANTLSESCLKRLRESPGYFYIRKQDNLTKKFSTRKRPMIQEMKYWLSPTTLIVCPDNLFPQWVGEINKHVKKGTISVLENPSTESHLPPAIQLIQYDIILFTTSSFASESQNPDSPLRKVCWKRLIIDEGHSMNQRSTRVVEFSCDLLVERRWAVTGTPTAGMTTLYMNENSEVNPESYVVKRTFDAKDDLKRLGYMVGNFFRIEPWKSNRQLWRKSVIDPFIKDSCGATLALRSLIDNLVVRHSPEQIENDVTLPPLFHEPVFLTPSTHNKLSINLFTAVLAINAVSSEREDQDYMFHPSSKNDLRRLVTNLQRATFYWTGFSVDDLETMVKISHSCLEKKNSEGRTYYNENDIRLLQMSIKTCQRALSDTIWRTASTIHEMGYYIGGLNDLFAEYFSIGNYDHDVVALGAPQIYAMQRFYFKHRFMNYEGNFGDKVIEFSEEFWNSYWRNVVRKNTQRVKKNDGQPIDTNAVDREIVLQVKASSKTSPSSKKIYDDVEILKGSTGRINQDKEAITDPTSSFQSTKNACLLGSSSAKLSYLVSRLLEHQCTGIKSIVFFEFEDSAYYLSEAFDILGIDYTLYATSVPKKDRPSKIDFFTQATTAHVLLMDLKLASHGLTITCATRAYFINPVWSRSVEAQAIKRAHRIGQTQPVHVETLILKGSLEEEMFKLRSRHEDSTQVVADDDVIQKFISRFDFLNLSNDIAPYCKFSSKSVVINEDYDPNETISDHLLSPTARLNNGIVEWNVPVFNREAQTKVSLGVKHQPPLHSTEATASGNAKVIRRLQFDDNHGEKVEHLRNIKRVRFE